MNAPAVALACVATRRVRIEMESSELLSKLYELILLKRASSCDCRHGGICQEGGDCLCPMADDFPLRGLAPRSSLLNHAFGWAGPACDDAACDDIVAAGCSNDEPSNSARCAGPNTCGCPAGWHGTLGTQQCTHTQCGDGAHDRACAEESQRLCASDVKRA